ncbi:hypothetical protein BGX34_009451 [Mortierella sp. NVP85]|nr:hypothetical protein BGX34_009451 [Mortierella sp. NVP85]
MSSSSSSSTTPLPTYSGLAESLELKAEDIPSYFTTTKIEDWSLESFLVQGGKDASDFCTQLKTISRINRLPHLVKNFASELRSYYSGPLGEERIKLAAVNAKVTLKDQVLTSKKHLNVQLSLENTFDEHGKKTSKKQPSGSLVPKTREAPSISRTTTQSSHLSLKSTSTRPSLNQPSATGPRAPTTTSQSPASRSTSSSSTSQVVSPSGSAQKGKSKKKAARTEEPWHSLMICLNEIVNGAVSVTFPTPPAGMNGTHLLLFNHAVQCIDTYLKQDQPKKDLTLLKDAQVSMSCVLNTLSSGVCTYMGDTDGELVSKAREQAHLDGFEKHLALNYLVRYSDVLQTNGIEHLRKRVIVDRGTHQAAYMDKAMPPSAVVEDQVLEILLILGEKALESSRIMRRYQSAEYGDISDSGRKVDCLFSFKGIELANIEFKTPDISPREIAVQNRKNVRLARAIQESHAESGVPGEAILMADVTGFIGTFYQVFPMGVINVAGRTTERTVQIPTTEGAMELFLTSPSLAILFNFIDRLETQGPRILKARQRHQALKEKERHENGIAQGRSITPPPPLKRFSENISWSPSKKRHVSSS